jgi:hypothetical protein
MAIDEQRVQKLKDELDRLQRELDLCKKAQDEVRASHSGGGAGFWRGWVPDCSQLSQDIASVNAELQKALKGEPPTPSFQFPSSRPGPPSYLGPDSQELYKKIMGRTGTLGQLPYWWAGFETGTDASKLLKGQINQDISDFLKNKGSTLNSVEKDYWTTAQQKTSK